MPDVTLLLAISHPSLHHSFHFKQLDCDIFYCWHVVQLDPITGDENTMQQLLPGKGHDFPRCGVRSTGRKLG